MKIFSFFFPLLAKISEFFQSKVTVTLKTLTVIPRLGPIAQYIKY